MKTIEELENLWEQLGDIPVDSSGEITDAAFLHFEAGTDVHDIWAWFEEQNTGFICGDRLGLFAH